MKAGGLNLFWDSCVFHAFLRDERDAYDVDSIARYLREASEGQHKIYTSSIVFAEVLPSTIGLKGKADFRDFLEDFQGSIIPIDASVNIVALAGALRDLPYSKTGSKRRLGTPDAIMLATCIHLQEVYGVTVDRFHTFDDGKKRGEDGKSVPLLSYETWCEGFSPAQQAEAERVISLNRCRPVHPAPGLFPVEEVVP